MSNEKYLWKYSSSISPQQYIFSLAEMTRTLINVVVCSHWGQAGQLAQERSPHPLKPGCRQWTKVRISLLSDHGALYTVHSTVLYTVHCTVTVHWLQHLSWALQTLQQPDKVTLQCCMPLIGHKSLIQTSHWPTCIFSEFDGTMY